MFHRVAPKEKTINFVSRYNKGQDKNNFELILKESSRYFEFINLSEFISVVTGKRKLKKNSLLITFDDADADFFEYAFPYLKKNNWSAVMFAPTDFIETENHFWHLTITNMIQNLNDDIWQQFHLNKELFSDKIRDLISEYAHFDSSLKLPLCRKLLFIIDEMDVEDIKDTLKQFEKITKPEYTIGIKCMNWEQLQEINKKNIEVGSHTCSHWKLTQLDTNRQNEELINSKKIIETRLNKKISAFCYPSGDFNDEVALLAKETGYLISFTTKPGMCRYPLSGIELMKIPRVGLGGINRYEINYNIGRLLI